MLVSEAVGATLADLADLGTHTLFGVVGSGNFHVTNALVARGARFVATRPVPRAQASAAHAAPHSCRAATNLAPRATSALVT